MNRSSVVATRLGGVALVVALAILFRPGPSDELGRVVFDFAAHVDQAERYCQPDVVIDGSSETQTRFLDGRWLTLDKRAGGLRSIGPAAGLLFPALAVDAELELDVEPVGDAGGPHDTQVSWTGGTLDRFEARGRVRRRVKIPASALGMGVNAVQITCPSARFIELYGARLSPAEKGGRGEPWYPLGSFCRGQGDQARIVQVPGARLAYSVSLPAQAALSFGVPPGPRRRVVVETEGGTEHEVFDTAAHAGERQTVRLPWKAGEIVRIHFRASPPGDGGQGLAEWVAPRLVAPTPAAATKTDPTLPRRPNIVVYVMDALRADHLQPYGYARATSPRIAEFARQAITFERAFAHSVWTKPSVGSLLTGLLPHEHGAMYDTASMRPDVPTLAQRLARAGYTCLAYQANDNADFRRGYHVYHGQTDLIGRPTSSPGSGSSRLIYERIRAEADRLREPFFLFVQAVDPHYPYGSPDEEDRLFVRGHPLDGEPVRAVFQRWMARAQDETEAHRLETSYLVGLYDSSIRHNDRWFGALVDLLQARGVYDRTAVLLTADHGEGFRDHGYETGHGAFYQHTLRVPLVLKLPGTRPPRRSSVPVQHLDVVPTALALAGARDPKLPGASLLGSVEEAPPAPRTIYAVHGRDRVIRRFSTEGRAVVSWPYKLIQPDAWRPLFELYDLEHDPDERRNLWPGTPSLPPTIAYLRTELERPPLAPIGGDADVVFTPEDMEELRALGYVQ